ncbi:MAG: peroxisome assembly protein (Peroxin-2) [Watsoniomyces obsoletus]|nr:MAG: peroxisome assembly protein (Peroxin-2) [Watsoniomyces obsoletus]
MDVAIELPAAANPLTLPTLFATLQAAASSDQQQVQNATLQLQSWETENGYYSSLQDVYIDHSLPVEVRYLAIIQLKNGIDRYWRKTAIRVISKDEKSLIRTRLIQSGIDEADRRLALQNAVITAKIVRLEYPQEWPEVIPQLVNHLRSAGGPDANSTSLPRTLLMLHHVVKELVFARMARYRWNLQSITPEIVQTLCGIYVNKYAQWFGFLENGGEDEGGAFDAIEQTLVMLKVLRRLMIHGYEFPHRCPEVREFWVIAKRQFDDLLVSLMRGPSLSRDVQQLLEKHVMQLSKLHLNMLTDHPAAFVLLPDSLAIVMTYWMAVLRYSETLGPTPAIYTTGTMVHAGHADDVGDEKPLLERMALQGLLVFRACIRMVFNPTQSFKFRNKETKQEQKRATESLRKELLTDHLIQQMMEIIISRLLLLSENDLREWREEPEEWERRNDSQNTGWEFSVRGCAERLLLDILLQYKDLLIGPLLAVLDTVSNLPPEDQQFLFVDAVYTAVGLAAPILCLHLDFDRLLQTRLVAEVQTAREGSNVIRRRVAILLGQWASVGVSSQNFGLIHQIFQHLLDRNESLNDHVVLITAGKHLHEVVNGMDFEPHAFGSYALTILNSIMGLIESVELAETKMALLNTVSIIVERMAYMLDNIADIVATPLPQLWERSGQEYMLKQSILTIMTRLITSLKEKSPRYHGLALSFIKHSVDSESAAQVYLVEDGLELWGAVIAHTPEPASPEILSLAPYLFPTFELGTEQLRKGLEITESYVLLAPREMLATEFRTRLLTALASLLGTLRPLPHALLTRVIDDMLREADLLGGEEAVSVIATGLVECGIMFKLMDGLRGCWRANRTSGPNRVSGPVETEVETDYFCILARLLLCSRRVFLRALESIRPPGSEDVDQAMNWLLTEWFNHFGVMPHETRRKLNCLALTSLLETGAPWILNRLQDLMTVWTDVIIELQDGSEEPGKDRMALYPSGQDVGPHETGSMEGSQSWQSGMEPPPPEEKRRDRLRNADPIWKLNTSAFVREHLQQVIVQCGGQERFQQEWLINIDPEVMSDFAKLGVL